MKKYLIIAASILLMTASCKDDQEKDPVYNGEITLSSELILEETYYGYGFSFEEEKFYSTLNPPVIIDIYLNVDGQFATKESLPGTAYGFYLNNTFISQPEALAFYNNYLEVNMPSHVLLTDTIQANQVYTFRTTRGNYVKILIKDFRTVTKTTGSYYEADLKYYIQRNGSDIFNE